MSVFLTKNGQVMPFQSTDMIDYQMALKSGWTPTTQGAANAYNAPVMQQYEQAVTNAAAPAPSSSGPSATGGTATPGTPGTYTISTTYGKSKTYTAADVQAAQERLNNPRYDINGGNLNTDMLLVNTAKKAGWTPTTATPTPTSPTPAANAAGTKGTGTIDMTGWTDSERALYGLYQNYVDKMKAQGKVVNPSIVVDQALIDRFKSQARTELEPYYNQVFKQADEDIARAAQETKEGYSKDVRDIGSAFGKNLETTQETYARRGLEFSSERQRAEQMLADEAKQKMDEAAKAAEKAAYKVGTEAERTLGTSNIPNVDWSIGTGQAPILGKAGVYGVSGSTGSRNLFAPVGGTTGTTERQQTVDLATRENALAENERLYRANLYA